MNTNHIFDKETALWLFGDKRQSLQDLASFQLVKNIWFDIMLSGKHHNIKSELSSAVNDTLQPLTKQLKSLRLPSSIEKLVTQSIVTIQQSLRLWVAYHYEQMLSGLVKPGAPARRITLYTCHLKYAVFHTNGDMNYEASARKMLKAKQFDNKISFEIMCRFCMEDWLCKLPTKLVLSLKPKFSWEKNPLAWYWICFLTNRLHSTDFPMFVYCCPYIMLIKSTDCDNWSNIRYFWTRVCDVDDQSKEACRVLSNINLNWYLKNLYWEMSANQWKYVFNTIPVEILITFFRQYQENEKGLFLWKRMKGTFTGKVFAELLQRVFNEKTNDDRDWSMSVAMEMWQTAEDHLKNYVLKYDNDIIADNFFDPLFIRKSEKSMTFLFDLLSFALVQYRKQLMLNHGDVLFMSDDLPGVDKIVKLCLPKAHDFSQFQKFLTKSACILLRINQLLTEGKFAYLNKFFDQYFPKDPATKAYKREIFELNEKGKGCTGFIFEPTTWSEFEKFINSVHGPFVVTQIIKRYIRSFRLDCIKDRGNIDQLKCMEKLVARFLTHNEVAEFKKSLLDDLKNTLEKFVISNAKFDDVAGKFIDAGFLRRLVSWCCSNKEEIQRFKRTLPMKRIFADIVGNVTFTICHDYANDDTLLESNNVQMPVYLAMRPPPYNNVISRILSVADELFKWYCDGVEQTKKFKLARMFAFDDLELLEKLNRAADMDPRDTNMLLVWLLCNDEDRIREFKARFSEFNLALKMDKLATKNGQPKPVCSYDAILNVI